MSVLVMNQSNPLNSKEHFKLLEEKIPLKTTEGLDSFDFYFKASEELQRMWIAYIKRIGGKDMKEHVNRALGCLLTNDLGTKLSWFGLRGNLNASKYSFMKSFVDVITVRYQTDCSSVEKQINEWLRLSKQRLIREKNKDNTL